MQTVQESPERTARGPAPGAVGRRLGPATVVTLVRAALVVVTAVLVLTAPDAARWGIASLASVALVLDGVDGWVARRTATASAFGARLDMEVDAALVLVLAVHVAGRLGIGWVLLIGLARYLLVVVTWVAPWTGSPVPQRFWRKTVAVAQVVALVATGSGVVGGPVARWVLGLAGGALLVSFVTQVWEVRATRPHPTPRRSALSTGLAVVVVWLVLAAPDDPLDGAAALVQLPGEAVVLTALVLATSGSRGGRRSMAALSATALAVLAVLRVADLGFSIALGRRSDPWTDIGRAGSAASGALDAFGLLVGTAIVVATVLASVALVALVAWSALRVTRLLTHRRRTAARWMVAAAGSWAVVASLGLTTSAATPLAGRSTVALVSAHAGQIRANAADRAAFSRLVADDPLAPDEVRVPAALAGKDVLLVFVESYGRHAVEDPAVAPGVHGVLDRGTAALSAAGFGARSAFLTSPTYGGLSWLAHSTVQSGLWVDRQGRYDVLLASRRTTLTGLFARSGWRTACVVPANRHDWEPARSFYRCDATYDARNLGYDGPEFGYPPVPDAFTLAAFARTELGPGHPPVMAEIDLVTSHAPWSPLPPAVPWAEAGNGHAYAAVAGPPDRPGGQAAAYGAAVEYSLQSLVDFVTNAGDRDLVVVVLGDHQPYAAVSGSDAGRDVPVSVVARDPEVLHAIAGWGWTPGLRPAPDAPVWRMDSFRTRFLAAFQSR